MIVVIDTNVIVAALKSRRGTSSDLLRRLAAGDFESAVSTALILEYDDVLHRPGMVSQSSGEIDRFIDSICAVSKEAAIYFAWRPFLPDPKDDLVVECALAAGASAIITFNGRDFAPAHDLGISVMTPAKFTAILEDGN